MKMSKKPAKRKIIDNAGYPILRLPIKLFRELGIKLGQEVYVERVEGVIPFSWEIRVIPVLGLDAGEAADHDGDEEGNDKKDREG